MRFTKMTGAGNDFIVADAEAWARASESVASLCDRRYGIGADGLMAISPPPRITVAFYNADGSGDMLCGNGARCALVYAARRGWAAYGEGISFEFAGRPYRGVALGPDRSRFELNPRYSTRLEEGVEIDGARADGRFVDLGSPHFIVDIGELELGGAPAYRAGPHGLGPAAYPSPSAAYPGPSAAYPSPSAAYPSPAAALAALDLNRLGPAFRRHARFGPEGANLSVCALEGGLVHIRTFERGVEAETLACGTGSTAAALSYALRGLARPPVGVRTRSGETLVVDFNDAREPGRLTLEGPARAVFEGETEAS